MRKKLSRVDGVLEDGLPWGGELVVYPLAGTRMGEALFFHAVSETLIVTDLVFHYGRSDFRGLARLFMGLNGALEGFGPTRLARWLFFADKRTLAASMKPVLDLDIRAVIMSHGQVVERDGGQKMREALPGG